MVLKFGSLELDSGGNTPFRFDRRRRLTAENNPSDPSGLALHSSIPGGCHPCNDACVGRVNNHLCHDRLTPRSIGHDDPGRLAVAVDKNIGRIAAEKEIDAGIEECPFEDLFDLEGRRGASITEDRFRQLPVGSLCFLQPES